MVKRAVESKIRQRFGCSGGSFALWHDDYEGERKRGRLYATVRRMRAP
jgi:hypothetical protein